MQTAIAICLCLLNHQQGCCMADSEPATTNAELKLTCIHHHLVHLCWFSNQKIAYQSCISRASKIPVCVLADSASSWQAALRTWPDTTYFNTAQTAKGTATDFLALTPCLSYQNTSVNLGPLDRKSIACITEEGGYTLVSDQPAHLLEVCYLTS